MGKVLTFQTKEEIERYKSIQSLRMFNSLSHLSTDDVPPRVEEIIEFVKERPRYVFEFARMLVEKHHWSLDNALAFIRLHYKKPAE